MTNEELKKKIVDIALHAEWTDIFGDHNSIGKYAANAIADALIAEGIGDVKEAEHRAARAERALKNRAISHVSKCFPNEISGLENCVQEVYEAWIYQAEKELAEENGGKKKV